MSDKNKMHDEEYQFPHDENYADDLQPIKPEDEEPMQALIEDEPSSTGLKAIWDEHKRMILIISAVIVVAIVFTVFRTIQHKQDTVPVTIPESAPVVTQTVQPVVDPQLNDQVNGLKQDSINNTVAIRQLQRQVQQLDSNLNQSRASQQQLNQSMLVLVSQVQQLTAEVKAAHAPKLVKAPVKAKPAETPITFQLRAVVPGRAWVVGSDGQSLSVAIGDQIPQYGAVQTINADEGVVLTTSGKTVRFSQ